MDKLTLTADDILTVQEVCQLLRIGRDEVYRQVHNGHLPVMRFGKHGHTWRFLKTDLMKLSRCEEALPRLRMVR